MNKEEQLKFILDLYPATTNHMSKRRIRHTFFQNIQTEIQAYLLGFYVADGSISECNKTFRVELQKGDCDTVYLFKDWISNDARLYLTKEREFIGPRGQIIHAHGNIGIDITSSQICRDLVKLGYGYKKSYSDLKLPLIDKSLIRHFIRGYFDGDGCICGYIKKQKDRNDLFVKLFDFCSKTSSLLIDIQKFFSEHDIKISLNYQKRDKMYRLRTCSKKEVVKIYHLLYDCANFYMDRKFNKFNHYVNTEDLQLLAEARNALEMKAMSTNNSPKSSEHPTSEGENVC